MAGIVDLRTGQTEVNEFLTLEGSSFITIHTCLRYVYGEDAIDVRTVRLWSVVSKAVERTLMTSPAAADQPR